MEASIAPCVCQSGAGFLISSKKAFYSNVLAVSGSFLQSCRVPDLKQGEAYLVSFASLLQRSSSSVVAVNVDSFCAKPGSADNHLLCPGKLDTSKDRVGLAKAGGRYGVLFSQLEHFFDSISDSPFFASLPDSVDFDIPAEDEILFLPLIELVRASSKPLLCIPVQSVEAYYPLPSSLSTPARLDCPPSTGITTVCSTSSFEEHEASSIGSTVDHPTSSRQTTISRILVQTAPLRRAFSSPLRSNDSFHSSPAISELSAESFTAMEVDLQMQHSSQENADPTLSRRPGTFPKATAAAPIAQPGRGAPLQRSLSSIQSKNAVPRPLTRARAVQGETNINAINQQLKLQARSTRGGGNTRAQSTSLQNEMDVNSAEGTLSMSSTSTVFAVMSSSTESRQSPSRTNREERAGEESSATPSSSSSSSSSNSEYSSQDSSSSGQSNRSPFSPFSVDSEGVRREDVEALRANLFGGPLSQQSTISNESGREADAKERAVAMGKKRKLPSPSPPTRIVRSASAMETAAAAKRSRQDSSVQKMEESAEDSNSLPRDVLLSDWIDLSCTTRQSPSLPALSASQTLAQRFEALIQHVEDDSYYNQHMPFPVPGRERESVYLFNQLLSALRLGRGKLIYLSGLPGCGKSQTAQVTVRYLKTLFDDYCAPYDASSAPSPLFPPTSRRSLSGSLPVAASSSTSTQRSSRGLTRTYSMSDSESSCTSRRSRALSVDSSAVASPCFYWVKCTAMGNNVRQNIFESINKLCGLSRKQGQEMADEVKRHLMDAPVWRPQERLPWTSWELDHPQYATMSLFTRSLADAQTRLSSTFTSQDAAGTRSRNLPASYVSLHNSATQPLSRQLSGSSKASTGKAAASAKDRLAPAPMIILVLEEIDCLNQAVFHELSELTARGRLIVIGSGNTVGAVEHTPSLEAHSSVAASSSSVASSKEEMSEPLMAVAEAATSSHSTGPLPEKEWGYPSSCSLVFAAYSVEDLCTIVTHRVRDLFQPKAVECLARQVTKNHKGDVRKLLGQMVAAMKNALANQRNAQPSDSPAISHLVTVKDVITTNAPSYDQLQRETVHALTSDLLLLLAAMFQWFGSHRSFLASEVPKAYAEYAKKFNLNERFTLGIKKGLDLLLDSTAIKLANAGVGENKRYCVSVDPKVLLSAPCFGIEHGMVQSDFRRHMELVQQQQELENEEENL